MSKKSGFDGVFLDGTTGLTLIGLDIAVYNSSGSTLSTIYTTKEGNTLKANPFTTTSESAGLVQFWAEPGYYEIEVSDSLGRISTRRIPFDAVAGDTSLGEEGISLDQIPKITTAKIDDAAVTTEKIDDGAVTTAKIDDGAVTGAKIAASTTATPTFSSAASSEESTLTARKYADGRVLLSGSIVNGTYGNLEVLVVYATLPVGYRPAAEVRAPAVTGLEGAPVGGCVISTNGEIEFSPKAAGFVMFLDGITFHAA